MGTLWYFTTVSGPLPTDGVDGVFGDAIKVGILHSLSGTMAISETSVRDAEVLAINEINAAGGVLGKQLVPVFEEKSSLLWYPVQYEGMERSPNIFYVGAAPNQQIVPAVDYLAEHYGTKIFLVGSDYAFPCTANAAIKAQAAAKGYEIVGETYTPPWATPTPPRPSTRSARPSPTSSSTPSAATPT